MHDIGVSVDVKKHHKAGRDVLLRHPPVELEPDKQPIVAWTTFLHRKRVDADKLSKFESKHFSAFPARTKELIFKLASILRIADGLDYSRMDSEIVNIYAKDKVYVIEVGGPGATTDVARAMKKSDLWGLTFDTRLQFEAKANSPVCSIHSCI